jgi:intracellular multiplication protein IcmE
MYERAGESTCMSVGPNDMSRRAEICRKLGLRDEAALYRFVMESAREGAERLIARGLSAPLLQTLGYTIEGMRRLGYTDAALVKLGYRVIATPAATPGDPSANPETTDYKPTSELCQRVRDGAKAGELLTEGYTVHHLKRAGCSATDLARAGFTLRDLSQAFSASELRRAGYGARELRGVFHGSELRSAGFQAADMRTAGFSIRELLTFGYNENEVRTAGYTVLELQREGLSKQTVDKVRFQY